MHVTDTVRSILRRWYVFATGVVLSLVLGWTAYQSIPTTYTSSGSVLLMPSEVTVGDTGNPFLYLGGMTNAVDVLIRRANATEVREGLLEDFDGAEYSITRDLTTESPITVVSVEAPTADMATDLRDVALTTIEQNLDAMQNDLEIESDLRIYLRDVVVDTEATEDNKTAVQLALVVFGAGLIGTFMLTGIIDGIMIRRRERRGAAPSAGSASVHAAAGASAADPHPEEATLTTTRDPERRRVTYGPSAEPSTGQGGHRDSENAAERHFADSRP